VRPSEPAWSPAPNLRYPDVIVRGRWRGWIFWCVIQAACVEPPNYEGRACASASSCPGDLVCERAHTDDGKAWWPSGQWPQGVGGFAHGSTGIGWALSRLAEVSGSDRHRDTAAAGFAFERSLFLPEVGGWRDLREENQEIVPTAWCHGTVGIGVAHLDLDPELRREETREIVRIAAATACRTGIGWNHTLCHGDLGVWELVDRAARKGLAPEGVSSESLLAHILSSLEEFSAICGIARDAFSPGLFSGVGGVAYQLLRAHPEHGLPSVMTLEAAA